MSDAPAAPVDAVSETPQHGFQGDRSPGAGPAGPQAPSIAVSREVGARGGAIARRLGARIGWQVYDRDMLEFAARDPATLESVLAELPPDAVRWIEERLRWLHQHDVLSRDDGFEDVARLILALGAKGESIFVGHGAGFILPRETTLHVRFVAPLPDRIAYFSQWLRLPRDEAAEQVRLRGNERDGFLAACIHLPSDGIIYDMVLNSSSLGEELSAELVTQALKCKTRAYGVPEATE